MYPVHEPSLFSASIRHTLALSNYTAFCVKADPVGGTACHFIRNLQIENSHEHINTTYNTHHYVKRNNIFKLIKKMYDKLRLNRIVFEKKCSCI